MSGAKHIQFDKLHKGHSVFELNCKTKKLQIVSHETYRDVFGKRKIRVIANEYCIYDTALNERNAAAKFMRFLEKLPAKSEL